MIDWNEEPQTDKEKLEDSEEYCQKIFDRFMDFSGAVGRWLMLDRNAIVEKVIGGVISTLKETDSPEPIQGIENGFDYMGVVRTEGGDNMLYELSMDTLRGEIWHRVASLDSDEKAVLFLPYCDRSDLSELAIDVEVDSWSQCIFSRCDYIWLKPLMDEVLYRIPVRYRRD